MVVERVILLPGTCTLHETAGEQVRLARHRRKDECGIRSRPGRNESAHVVRNRKRLAFRSFDHYINVQKVLDLEKGFLIRAKKDGSGRRLQDRILLQKQARGKKIANEIMTMVTSLQYAAGLQAFDNNL